jgi:hypothetical protein
MARRDEVIQSYLDLFDGPSYLEIGVSRGATFHAVKAARKVAVDPRSEIALGDRETRSEYHEVTSDRCFDSLAGVAARLHVIYLDGLHTFEQTLRDLMNAIECLNQDGVIVVDDVLPSSYHASLRDYSETIAVREGLGASDHSWMGDTYRLMFFLQSFMPRFDYATVEDNHGQLVIWRSPTRAGQFLERRIEDIARLEFRDVVTQRSIFNLLPNAEIGRQARNALRADVVR